RPAGRVPTRHRDGSMMAPVRLRRSLDKMKNVLDITSFVPCLAQAKGGVMEIGRWCLWRAVVVVLGSVITAGCPTFGPRALEQTRLHYNEAVKRTTEEQLLLNIVRLRYTDTPSSLAVSAIAAQFERSSSLQLTPFFVAGNDASFTSILPQALAQGADRPTVSFTPLDDQ